MRHHGSVSPLPPAAAVVVTLAGVAAMFLGSILAARLHLGMRAVIAAGTVALAVPALIALVADRSVARSALGARPLDRRPALLAVLLGAALWVASIGLMEMQSLLAPPPTDYLQRFRAIHEALTPRGPLDALLSLATIAVLPGICEELVVRGVLLPSLAARMPGTAAVLVSAALFAAMHGDPYRFLFTFAIGIVFGYVRLWTGTLWTPVIAHTTLNTLTFLIAPLVDDPKAPYTPQPLLGLTCLLVGSAVVLPLLRRLHPSPTAPPEARA